MPRNLTLVSAAALALFFSMPGHAQNSPSLGDITRQVQQAQKDKASKPVTKVFTNDDMSTGSSGPTVAAGSSSAANGASGPMTNPGAVQSSAEGLDRLQSALDQLASLDRTSLAADVLEGNTSNFPGRAAWEEKLFAAKQTFVAETRITLQKAKQVAASAQEMKGAEDQNDPRVKNLGAKLVQIVQEAQRNSGSFQSVVAEGKALAARPVAQ